MAKTVDPRQIALNDLQSACIEDDPVAAYRATLALAEATWPDAVFRGTPAICRQIGDDELSSAISGLERALYGPDTPEAGRSWQGDAYWRIVSVGLDAADGRLKPTHLIAPLHP